MESFRKAIVQFEKVLKLARSAKVQDKQAFSLFALGRLHDLLGKKQEALEFYNQSLPLRRALGDRARRQRLVTSLVSTLTWERNRKFWNFIINPYRSSVP